MALAHAVLALLTHNPCSGYDIAKQFERSVGYFWRATHQQIYRELKKLEQQGRVRVEVVAQEGPLDKKLYHITEDGKQNLQDWITQDCDLGAVREDLLVKLFAGYLVPTDEIIRQLEQHQRSHEKKLATYRSIADQFFAQPDALDLPELGQYLTLRRGIRSELDWIAWCEEAMVVLKSRGNRGT